MSLLFCCRRRTKRMMNNPKDIKMDLNINKIKNKDASSLEINQSNSLSMMSNHLNHSTKDNIFQKRKNIFNIVNHLNENQLDISNNKYNNLIYNIINVDNINNNKKNAEIKSLNSFNTNDKIIYIKEENSKLGEREKKLFEKESELSNKEKEINNRILELIQKNRKLNEQRKIQIQKNSIINDVIKFKKVVSDYEEKNNMKNKAKKIDKLDNKKIII